MSNVKSVFAAFQSVKVTEEGYERTGQVGVVVGPGDEEGETAVKFEAQGGAATTPQEIDTFPNEALTGV